MNNLLSTLLGEFYTKLSSIKEIVPREARFPAAPNKIKVAIGMRRVGKTYFLFQTIHKLLEEGVDKSQILYVNFEDDRLLFQSDTILAKLVEAFYELFPQNHSRKCYLFFDEVQNVSNWPLVVRRLHDTKNVELFLTGSSAKLLSKEIASSLRGRSLAIEIWPYSFTEYLRAKKIAIKSDIYDKKTADHLMHAFRSYLEEGGFPEVVSLEASIRQQILQEYLDIAIFRDIVERHQIKHPSVIKFMILSMILNVGKPFAINKFYADLKNRGYSIGKDLLYEYVDHIEDSYIAFNMPVYHKSLRKTYTNPKKAYAIDPGMTRALTMEFENDLGRLFENVVYLDLRRKGLKISYFDTKEKYEVDFLTQDARGNKKLIQVSWKMDDKKTEGRELRALELATKELKIKGEVITLDSYLKSQYTCIFS